MPVWALIGVAVCNGCGFSVIFTQLPTYIEGVLGVAIEKVSEQCLDIRKWLKIVHYMLGET